MDHSPDGSIPFDLPKIPDCFEDRFVSNGFASNNTKFSFASKYSSFESNNTTNARSYTLDNTYYDSNNKVDTQIGLDIDDSVVLTKNRLNSDNYDIKNMLSCARKRNDMDNFSTLS